MNPSLILPGLVLLLAVSTATPGADPVDAISREVSLFLPDDEAALREAISREISVFVPDAEAGLREAISREVSVFLPAPEDGLREAISREISVFLPEAEASLREAISREISVLVPTEEEGFREAISRELSVFLPSPIPPPPGLLAWWPAEGSALDFAGTNHGTLRNGAGFAAGMVGEAFRFDGLNDYVQVPGEGVVRGHSEVSVAAWVRIRGPQLDQDGWGHIWVEHGSTKDVTRLSLAIVPDGRARFGGRDRSATPANDHAYEVFSMSPIPTNQWIHLLGTWKAGEGLKLFLNGTRNNELSDPSVGLFADSPSAFIGIGRYDDRTSGQLGADSFNGDIDEVAIWARALSSGEIAALFEAGASGMDKKLTPPYFVAQPQDVVALESREATLTSLANGAAPLHYQWFFNNAPVAEATNATLFMPAAKMSNAGRYFVQASNTLGVVTSQVAFLTVITGGDCAPAPPGLVAWWKGDGSAFDSAGTNHGTLMRGATFAPGIVGQALSLDGTNGYAMVPYSSNSPLFNLTEKLTYEVWVKPERDGYLIGRRQCQNAWPAAELWIWDSSVVFELGYESANTYTVFTSPPIVSMGQWHHLAATYDRAVQQVRLYLDGASILSGTYSAAIWKPTTPLWIGGIPKPLDRPDCWEHYFLGEIDEVSVYDRALSSNEIAAIYGAGASGKCVGQDKPAILQQPQSLVVLWGAQAAFRIVAASAVPPIYQWRFNGAPVAGSTNTTLSLTNAQPEQAGSYDVVVSNQYGSVMSDVAVLTVITNIPDLRLSALSAPTSAVGGQPVPVSWVTTNAGNTNAAAPWKETLSFADNANGANATPLLAISAGLSLGPGESASRTPSVILPTGLSGNYWFVAQADSDNQVAEGHGETNNVLVATQPMLMTSPDLEARELASAATGIFGQPLSLRWVVANAGTGPALGAWRDRVWLSPASNSLVGAISLANATGASPLPASGRYTNSATVTLPLAAQSQPGGYWMVLAVDENNAVAEANEVNNLRSAPLTLALPPLPDLVATNLVSLSNVLPGETVPLTWRVTNLGTATALSIGREVVLGIPASAGLADLLENDGSGRLKAGLSTWAAFTFTNSLAPGEFLVRTQDVTVPLDSATGNLRFVVMVDSENNVVESNETNNFAFATNTTTVPAVLRLSVPASLAEGASARASVTRNGSRAQALTVTVTNSDSSELSLDQSLVTSAATVVIPAGQATASFAVRALTDGVVDGPQPVTVAAAAAGFASDQRVLTVLDVDVPRLNLQIASATVPEGSTVQATLTRDTVTSGALTVTITSSDSRHLLAPPSVTIAAGQASTNFLLAAMDDNLIAEPTAYSVSAGAAGFTGSSASVTILDNDFPAITLTLAQAFVSEGAGPQATVATLTRAPETTRALTLELESSDTNVVRVPARISIPANQAWASFPVAAVDNDLLDGPKEVILSAYVLSSSTGLRLGLGATNRLVVTDDDGPTLKLALARQLVAEGLNPATTATVSRNFVTNQPLVVHLTSSDVNEATVPATVTILADQRSVEFPIATVNDGVTDGNKPVAITAQADGFTGGIATLTVSDTNLPDVVPTVVEGDTAHFYVGDFPKIRFRVENQGLAGFTNAITQRLFLSRDPLIGDDILQGNFPFQPGLSGFGPGLYFEQSITVSNTFTKAGTYWVVAGVDVNDAVKEINEANNTRISSQPIVVEPDFDAVVRVDLPGKVGLAGARVPLSGRVIPRNGQSPVGKLVPLHLTVREFKRVIFAEVKNADGSFAVDFIPLPSEAGQYTVGAAVSGTDTAEVQDTFALLGARFEPTTLVLKLAENESVSGSVKLQNLSEVPLTKVQAAALNVPPNLAVTITLGASTLEGSANLPISYVIVAKGLSPSPTGFTVQVTSAEGVTISLPVSVTIEPLRPRLVAYPAELVAGMVRGGQRVVEFDVVNEGRAVSGPLSVLVPVAPWLSLASTNLLPTIEPGQTNRVTLLLSPAMDLGFGEYKGQLAINGAATSLTVPFNFRALSDANGALKITVTDEYTYYAEGKPRVTNATVTIRDTVSQQVVAAGITDAEGEFLVPELIEGYYDLEVEAYRHHTYKSTTLALAGWTNAVEAFLALETVQYIWNVEPTEIEDRTKITIETVFETFVPAPVVTISPAYLDIHSLVESGKDGDFELKIENHGLIAAQNVELILPEDAMLTYEVPVRKIGVLPPNSSLVLPLLIRPAPEKHVLSKTNRARSGLQIATDQPCPVTAIICGLEVTIGELKAQFRNDPDNKTKRRIWISFIPNSVGRSLKDKCEFHFVQTLVTAPNDPRNPPVPENDPPHIGRPSKCTSPPLVSLPFYPGERWATPLWPDSSALAMNDAPSTVWPDPGAPHNECNPEGPPQYFLAPSFITHLVLTGPGVNSMYGKDAIVVLGGVQWSVNATIDPTTGSVEPHGKLYGCSVDISSLTTGLVHGGFPEWAVNIRDGKIDPVDCCFDSHGDVILCEYDYLCGLEKILGFAQAIIGKSSSCKSCPTSTATSTGRIPPTATIGGPGSGSPLISGARQFETSAMCAQAPFGVRITLGDGARSVSTVRPASSLPADGVCARVRLRLDQEVVLAHDAFKASLEIINSSGKALQDVDVEVLIKNSAGIDATDLFGIRTPRLDGISTVDGTGAIATDSTGRASWILIPASDAAPTQVTRYLVSGRLRYSQGGLHVNVPLAEVPITVYPSAQLNVKYVHQRDVFSDDPSTEEIEPSIPYSLAVMVQNTGMGTARNFHIKSAQPQIIENEKGLLIDFQLVASEVAGQNITPSLTVNFGDLGPGTNAIARWLFTSSLQGLFIDYKATFEHLDDLGNKKLLIITNVEIHEMTRIVQGPFGESRPDFLVNDETNDLRHLPDTVYLSDGSIHPVIVVETGNADGSPGSGHLQVMLTTPMPGAGFGYLRLPDPQGASGKAQYRLAAVRRSDGTNLPPDNFWQTDRTFIGMGRRPVRENILHLFDYNSTGQYTLVYEAVAPPPTVPPSSSVAALPANVFTNFPVLWSGSSPSGGLVKFDVLVSVDDGPFTPWLQKTPLTGGIFLGEFNRRYAFYSVAIDSAGNREASPGTPDARTTASLINTAPELTLPPSLVFDEGETVVITPQVANAESQIEALAFSLGDGSPPGATIDPATGLVTWPTGEGNGPSTNRITLVVRDNGIPPLSSTGTVMVVVREVNTAPALNPIDNYIINEGELLVVTNVATDVDVPVNLLQFSLQPGAPNGVTMDPTSGVLRWQPNELQGPSTNWITVMVADNGIPPMSATQQFSVMVRDTRSDFVLSLGSTNVFSGESNAVPVFLESSLNITSLRFDLETLANRLTNLTLQSVAPEVQSLLIQPVSDEPNCSQLTLGLNPALMKSLSRQLASLGFLSVSNEHSAIVQLGINRFEGALASGLRLTNGASYGGRVIVVGQEPVLVANRGPSITLYGKPGASYVLESTTNLFAVLSWTKGPGLRLADRFAEIGSLDLAAPLIVYRAYESSGVGPLLSLQGARAPVYTFRLQGRPGSLYSIQASTNLTDRGTWTDVFNFSLTNDWRTFDWTNRGEQEYLFRAMEK